MSVVESVAKDDLNVVGPGNDGKFNGAANKLTDTIKLMRWAHGAYSPKVGLSCSFSGPGGIVLAHLVYVCQLPFTVLFIDTGYLFPQTHELKETLETKWGLRVKTIKSTLSPKEQDELYGDALWERDPDKCCTIRKVKPTEIGLESFDCWMSGLRRDQSRTRSLTEEVEMHTLPGGKQIVKVNPLARWTGKEVWDYIYENDLPYHPLLDEGFRSIGCMQCTVHSGAVSGATKGASRDDERAGRWAGHAKTECGIHTFTQRTMS